MTWASTFQRDRRGPEPSPRRPHRRPGRASAGVVQAVALGDVPHSRGAGDLPQPPAARQQRRSQPHHRGPIRDAGDGSGVRGACEARGDLPRRLADRAGPPPQPGALLRGAGEHRDAAAASSPIRFPRTWHCWSTPTADSWSWRAAATRGPSTQWTARRILGDGRRMPSWAGSSLRRARFSAGLDGDPAARGPSRLPARRALHRDRGGVSDPGAGRRWTESARWWRRSALPSTRARGSIRSRWRSKTPPPPAVRSGVAGRNGVSRSGSPGTSWPWSPRRPTSSAAPG